MANNIVNKKYIKFVCGLDCCHCGNPETAPHHIINIGMGKMGGKAPDICTMPLCNDCHRLVHADASDWPQVKWMIETQIKAIEAGVL